MPFGVTRFDSIQRDAQWRKRIGSEEKNALRKRSKTGNPITGEGYAESEGGGIRRRRSRRGLSSRGSDVSSLIASETASVKGRAQTTAQMTARARPEAKEIPPLHLGKVHGRMQGTKEKKMKNRSSRSDRSRLTEARLQEFNRQSQRSGSGRRRSSSRSSRKSTARSGASMLSASSLRSSQSNLTEKAIHRIMELEVVLQREKQMREKAQQELETLRAKIM